tara:strand:- start:70531 stop:70956 length:426 start_codon:yes stop_codon:yes gene_type:complete
MNGKHTGQVDSGRCSGMYNGAMDEQIQSLHWPLVLRRGQQRVELHPLALQVECHYLVALAGDAARPQREHGQGPLISRALAESAGRGIARELVRQDYRISEETPRWQLPAWDWRRRVSAARHGHQVDVTFHPEDVWPWPGS